MQSLHFSMLSSVPQQLPVSRPLALLGCYLSKQTGACLINPEDDAPNKLHVMLHQKAALPVFPLSFYL